MTTTTSTATTITVTLPPNNDTTGRRSSHRQQSSSDDSNTADDPVLLRLTRPGLATTADAAIIDPTPGKDGRKTRRRAVVVLLTRSIIIGAANDDHHSDGSAATIRGCSPATNPTFVRSQDGSTGVYLTVRVPVRLPPQPRLHSVSGPRSILPTNPAAVKLSTRQLLIAIVPTISLLSMIYAWYAYAPPPTCVGAGWYAVPPTCSSSGSSGSDGVGFLDALFPSNDAASNLLVAKLTAWASLLVCVAYEHVWFWTAGPSRWMGRRSSGGGGDGGGGVEVEVTIWGWAADGSSIVPESCSEGQAAAALAEAKARAAASASASASASAKAGPRAGQTASVKKKSNVDDYGALGAAAPSPSRNAARQAQKPPPPPPPPPSQQQQKRQAVVFQRPGPKPLDLIDRPDQDRIITVTLPTPSARAGIELSLIRIGGTTAGASSGGGGGGSATSSSSSSGSGGGGGGVRAVPAVKSVSADGEAYKKGVKPNMVLLKFADRESVKARIRGGPYPVVLEFLDLGKAAPTVVGDHHLEEEGGNKGVGKGMGGDAAAAAAVVTGAAATAAANGPIPSQDRAAKEGEAAVGSSSRAAPPPHQQQPAAAASQVDAASSATAGGLTASASASAPPAQELPPDRFIAAEKGDIESARRRYAVTLAWRSDMGMDTIISEPHPNFTVIKKNWPHYYHLRGRNNEPCYYERPPDMNLKALRAAGISTDDLLRHYALTCEFMWTLIEPSEEGKSIYVIDLSGMGMRDFAGEVVDFVKRTSAFTAAHYPERSGSIFVINVPSWFSIIWKTVKPWVDPVTQKKIRILGYGDEAIAEALEERIPIENIPPEYGGRSMPLGQSPEEAMFREKMEKNNRLALLPGVEEDADATGVAGTREEHEHVE